MITVSMTRNSSNANWSCRRTPSFSGRVTVPDCGCDSPVSSFMKVDLPAPFGPVKPYRRPVENVVVTSSNRTFEPNRIDTPLTEIMKEAVLPGHKGLEEPPIVTYEGGWQPTNGRSSRRSLALASTNSSRRRNGLDRARSSLTKILPRESPGGAGARQDLRQR